MAQPNPNCKISFLFSFCNQKDDVEAILVPFLEQKQLPAEILIINDGSTDGTGDTIASLLDYYQNDQAFYFDNDNHRGRGNSLNEALMHSNAPCFLVIDTLCKPNPEIIEEMADTIAEGKPDTPGWFSENLAAASKDHLEIDPDSGSVPASALFLIRKSAVKTDKLFFNPFLKQGHSAELILRAGIADGMIPISHVVDFDPETGKSPAASLNDRDIEVIKFHAGKPEPVGINSTTEQEDESPHDPRFTKKGKPVKEVFERILYLREQGHFAEALDLVDEVLEVQPDFDEAERIKIFLLERLNRYMQASELKFARKQRKQREPDHNADFAGSMKPANDNEGVSDIGFTSRPAEIEQDDESHDEQEFDSAPTVHAERDEFVVTVIIPVTGVALPFLEPCLVTLNEYADPEKTELIVIDNACLDDTFSYLDQLRDKNFFNIRIIKNIRNAGFSKSVNQAIEKARGTYICVMHNDILLQSDAPLQLAEILEAHPEAGVIGPVASNSVNPAQERKQPGDEYVREVDYLDSFMLVFRSSSPYRMDEHFNPAWYEDVDLSWQVRNTGKTLLVADQVFVKHYLGGTTEFMGMGYDSVIFHKNLMRFNDKWSIKTPEIDVDADTAPLEELMKIGQVIHVPQPETKLLDRANTLLNSETRTELLKSNYKGEALTAFIRLMMAMDQREILRRLEDRLDEPVNRMLANELISYYFNKNIYSRCTKYLDMYAGKETLEQKIYRLKIAWSEKDLEQVVERLEKLMEEAPGHPELYKITGDLHKLEGNNEEAEEFYALADQLDPFRFPWETQV